MTNFISAFARLVVIGACSALLLGCGKSGDNQANQPKGQVVARIGEDVILRAELENEFRLANVPADKQKDPDILKRIFADLISRKYLYYQAIGSKLDREPSVLLDLLRAREGVLANAVISRNVAAKSSAISQAEIDKYVANNPAKFASRQLFGVEQITFAIGPNLQSVVDATKNKQSLDEVDQLLTSMNVPHGRSAGSISSSDLPDNLLQQVKQKKPDEIFFLRIGTNGMFLTIKSEESRPLAGEAAHNIARQALRADLLKSELGMASVAANLEARYEGDYATVMKITDPATPQK